VKYLALQRSEVQGSVVQCINVRIRVTVRVYRGKVHRNVVWCCTLQGRAVQRHAGQCSAVQCIALHSREVELST
jgi:hypothetical protein